MARGRGCRVVQIDRAKQGPGPGGRPDGGIGGLGRWGLNELASDDVVTGVVLVVAVIAGGRSYPGGDS